jgi:muramoyltetrapeptide carboxypeptidase
VLKASPLPEGGTIASPRRRARSRTGRDRPRHSLVRAARLPVKLAPGVYARDDFVAGNAAARAHDVTSLFADDEVDVVQMLRGGYGASQVVPLLDYDVIAANPKPFVGYSDVTALHVAIRQRTGLVTFYGLGLTSMGAPKRRSRTRSGSSAR